ncbi:MAG: WD40/YVTN/BNR-like repeat-containing protein [Bacteroidales bacterium]
MTTLSRWPAMAFMAFVMVSVPTWQDQPSGTAERLRGVAAVDARTAWACGNRGTVLRTTDGGRRWTPVAVPGAETLDFRDIEALDATIAFVLAIGAGDKSRIYKTVDGGRHWVPSFTNNDPRAFYDALGFWNAQTGLAVGDPVDGRFAVLTTSDGGKTWVGVDRSAMPAALPGEGAFAASGTCLVVGPSAHAWFVTGGAARARVFRSTDGGRTWQVADTPLAAGVASAGGFSVAFADDRHGIVVGGDYRKEPEKSENAAVTGDGGVTWTRVTPLAGFRSAVTFVPGTRGRGVIATGPAGSDWSIDGGNTWAPMAGPGFHALSIAARDGNGWGVGENGRIARIEGMAAAAKAATGK